MLSNLHLTLSSDFLLIIAWQGMLFNICAIIAIIIMIFILYGVRVSKLKNQKSTAIQHALKQSELLSYSIEGEQKAREQAKLANQTKSDLLARISREVRSPLNGVIGMASLLKETTLTAEQREYCETVQNCGENLLTTINDILFDDILAYSKIESGKIGGEKDFDLRNSIEEVLDVFASKSAKAGLELIYQVDQNVPSVIIAYSLWIRQILMNLVENAVRFTHQGEVVVRVQLIRTIDDNTIELGFEVSDTGAGIAPDKMKVLTKELSQSDYSKQGQRGTGVGLAICKKLVDVMGGRITIESKVGKGTTVLFTLNAKASIQPVRNHILQGMNGKKVLLIDDNATSLDALKSQIEEWKLLPVGASSGKEALEILMKTSDIDLVLTDMSMPDMDGISIARAIRKQLPKLPIVLLNNEGDESFKTYPDLFNSVLSKPIKQHLLSEHIFSNLKHLGETSVAKEQFGKQKLSVEFAKQYPLRILIAEDDRVNQKLSMRVLSKLGYNPDIAQNGKEVLEVVSQKNYDIVLMDVEMPEMDGLEATRMIRLCLTTQPVIIAMTAKAMQGDREECINAGMDDYISKPMNIEELVVLLEKSALQMKAKQ
ncbi:MAG: response regulator [Chryseolinea sp.]